MSNTWLFVLQALTVIVVLGLIYRPLGDYMAHVYTTQKNLRVERGFYRLSASTPHPSRPGRSTCEACWRSL